MMDRSRRRLEVWQVATEPEPDIYNVAAMVATIPDKASAVIPFAISSMLRERSSLILLRSAGTGHT